jgi:RHS repeat-associated protein
LAVDADVDLVGLDKETNLAYNYWRDFDGGLGRYIESDQIGLAGAINTYAYVDSNPLTWFDPDGAAKDKYQKPPNPNQRKGAQDRKPSGDRERNVKHPKGEEHSIKPKGGFKIRGCIPLLVWDIVNEYCQENPWALECIIMSPADPNEI